MIVIEVDEGVLIDAVIYNQSATRRRQRTRESFSDEAKKSCDLASIEAFCFSAAGTFGFNHIEASLDRRNNRQRSAFPGSQP